MITDDQIKELIATYEGIAADSRRKMEEEKDCSYAFPLVAAQAAVQYLQEMLEGKHPRTKVAIVKAIHDAKNAQKRIGSGEWTEGMSSGEKSRLSTMSVGGVAVLERVYELYYAEPKARHVTLKQKIDAARAATLEAEKRLDAYEYDWGDPKHMGICKVEGREVTSERCDSHTGIPTGKICTSDIEHCLSCHACANFNFSIKERKDYMALVLDWLDKKVALNALLAENEARKQARKNKE